MMEICLIIGPKISNMTPNKNVRRRPVFYLYSLGPQILSAQLGGRCEILLWL
jgi:hypothetical protein